MVQSIESRFESDGVTILKDSDPRVQYIERILRPLIQSCVYFSPECEYYMSQMEILVVDDDEINAYTTMGSIIVVYTGLLNYFKDLEKKGKISNYEEVCVSLPSSCLVHCRRAVARNVALSLSVTHHRSHHP